MKVLVCGGRSYNNMLALATVLDEYGTTEIVCGGATGADTLAIRWGKAAEIPTHIYPAEWRTLGKKAGPLRNRKMLKECRPDVVFAFPGGRGTADMIRAAEEAGVQVIRQDE